jgi:hypothetical protein
MIRNTKKFFNFQNIKKLIYIFQAEPIFYIHRTIFYVPLKKTNTYPKKLFFNSLDE